MPHFKKSLILCILLTGCSQEEIVCEKVVDQDHFFIILEKEYDHLISIRQKEIIELPKNLLEEDLKQLDEQFLDDERYFRTGHSISFYKEYALNEDYSARLSEFELLKKGYHCETTRKG